MNHPSSMMRASRIFLLCALWVVPESMQSQLICVDPSACNVFGPWPCEYPLFSCADDFACNYGESLCSEETCIYHPEVDLPTTGWGIAQELTIAAEGSLNWVSLDVGFNPLFNTINPHGGTPFTGVTCMNSNYLVCITDPQGNRLQIGGGLDTLSISCAGVDADNTFGPPYLALNSAFSHINVSAAGLGGEGVWTIRVQDEIYAGMFGKLNWNLCPMPQVEGCMDESACNYDASVQATIDDGSCRYDETCGDCDDGVPLNRCDCHGTAGIFDDFADEQYIAMNPLEHDYTACVDDVDLVTVNWTNNETEDGMDWIANVGPTEGVMKTGPTEGFHGKYLYLESSSCCGFSGILDSRMLDIGAAEVVRFSWRQSTRGEWSGDILEFDAQTLNEGVWSDWDNWALVSQGTGTELTLSSDGVVAVPDHEMEGEPLVVRSDDLDADDIGWKEVEVTLDLLGIEEGSGWSHYVEADSIRFRITGHTGASGTSDVALDDLRVCLTGCAETVVDRGEVRWSQLEPDCGVEILYTRPDNTACETAVGVAELRMGMHFGNPFIFGGVEELGALEAIIANLAIRRDATDDVDLDILTWTLDTVRPESRWVLDFGEWVEDMGEYDHFTLTGWDKPWYDEDTDSAVEVGPLVAQMRDSLRLDLEVIYRERVGMQGTTATLNDPVLPPSNSIRPVLFSWQGSCANIPLYRFQLLHLYDEDPDVDQVKTKLDEAAWANALTLETSEPELSMTLMEGTGHYAWRVAQIGNIYPGGAANNSNWGPYTSSTQTLDAEGYVTLTSGSGSNPDVLWHVDPAEHQNVAYARSFSRNEGEDGADPLLAVERAAYYTEDLFPQQSQTRMNSTGATIVHQQMRDFSGRTPLAVSAVPLTETEKQDLNYEPQLLTNPDGALYSAEDFDGDFYGDARAMGGAVSDYLSDANPDERVPNAQGYPFAAMTYKNDATGRVVKRGGAGETLRLGGGQETSIAYVSGVGDAELTRALGWEAPNPNTVHKVLTTNPDNVTSVVYIDKMGRTIMTCLARNEEMHTDIDPLPSSEFSSVKDIPTLSSAGDPFLWRANAEEHLVEESTLSLDYSLLAKQFEGYCGSYCGQCDYKVVFTVRNQATPEELIVHDSLLVSGDELVCGTALSGSSTWSPGGGITLGAGGYSIQTELRMNLPDADGRCPLDRHMAVAVADVRESMADALGDLVAMLDSIDRGLEDAPDVEAFYAACLLAADVTTLGEDGEVDWYHIAVGGCDTVSIPAQSCPYDCDPDTRDFEAFFQTMVMERLRDAADDPYLPAIDFDGSVYVDGRILDWDTLNVATHYAGLAEGEFNALVENLIASGEADPDRFEGYDCVSIHKALDVLAATLIRYTEDHNLNVVEHLIDILQPHFRGVKTDEEAGSFTGAEGWQTHPHLWVHFPLEMALKGLTACDSAGTAFADLDFSSATYMSEDESGRDSLELRYQAFENCLNGKSLDDFAGILDLTDVSSIGFSPCTIDDDLREQCETMVDYRKAIYPDLVDALLVNLGYEPDTYDFEYYSECWVGRLVAHAESYCDAIPDVDCDKVDSTLVSIIEAGKEYMVDPMPGTGDFVRYAGQEYGLYADGLYFQGLTGFTQFASSRLIFPSAGGCERDSVPVYRVEPDTSDLYALADQALSLMDSLGRVCFGEVSLCITSCDEGFEPVTLNGWVDRDTLLFEDFEFEGCLDTCTVTGYTGSTVPAEPTGWEPLPSIDYEKDDFGAPCGVSLGLGVSPYTPWVVSDSKGNRELILGGGTDDVEGWISEGGSVRREEPICLDPSKRYRLEMDVDHLRGEPVDHVFAVLASDLEWRPHKRTRFTHDLCSTCDEDEIFYPQDMDGVQVIGHFGDVHYFAQESVHFYPNPTLDATCTTDPNVVAGHLFLYVKQEGGHEPGFVGLDNIRIIEEEATDDDCGELFVKYSVPELVEDTLDIRTCEQDLADNLLSGIGQDRFRIEEKHRAGIRSAYLAQCAPEAEFTSGVELDYYHYTLYHFDVAGNLARTVPPKGVDLDDTHTRNSIPEHTLATTYRHNGMGNVIYRESPDAGVQRTWYDRLERVRFTQTAQDVVDGRFRYVCYDEVSRPVRSGVAAFSAALGAAGPSDLPSQANDVSWPVDDPSDDSDCPDCTERIYTVHDLPLDQPEEGFVQRNLFNRVSYVTNDMGDTTAYSYDAQGRVLSMHQHVEWDPTQDNEFDHILDFDFDPVSGNMLQVAINIGREDQFFQRLTYDEDQRVTRNESSDDGEIWHREAETEYFLHGPVRRTTLGHYGVQGVDFTYNLHGQMVGLNLPSDRLEDDPGQDGLPGSAHAFVAPDVFGLQHTFHENDFNRMGSPFTTGSDSVRRTGPAYLSGALSATSWRQAASMEDRSGQTVSNAYTLDELGRIRKSDFAPLDTTSAGWDATNDFDSEYTFDGNGNLDTLKRYADESDEGFRMDILSYHYESGNNHLEYVEDGVPDGRYDEDLDGQDSGNYAYDADGRLLSDNKEGITDIHWRVDDKVDFIVSSGDTIRFRYDALRQRVAKITPTKTTLYLRGIDGQVVGIYERTTDSDALLLAENPLGGGRRIPQDSITMTAVPLAADSLLAYSRFLGERQYSLSDNVENVRAVVSDRTHTQIQGDTVAVGVTADIVSASDYYPYGAMMQHRTYSTGSYRYGFNGKEKDDEVKGGSGNHYDLGARQYDPRVGRMLSLDPRTGEYPWQSPFVYHANQPQQTIDFMGEGAPCAGTICLNVRSKAPFNWFGPIQKVKGDGAGSTWNLDPSSGPTGNNTWRTESITAYDKGSQDWVTLGYGVESESRLGAWATGGTLSPTLNLSETFLTDPDKLSSYLSYPKTVMSGVGGVSIHQYAKLETLFTGKGLDILPSQGQETPTANIDIVSNIHFDYSVPGQVTVTGSIMGEGFPPTMAMVTDGNGVSVYLGVSPSSAGRDMGPFVNLFFEFLSPIIMVNRTIYLDDNDNFTAVEVQGAKIDIDDFNGFFEAQPMHVKGRGILGSGVRPTPNMSSQPGMEDFDRKYHQTDLDD